MPGSPGTLGVPNPIGGIVVPSLSCRGVVARPMSARYPCDVTSLEPDCAQCVGLCCVALPFRPSHGFAFAKDAGEPCRNLDASYGCSIHASLREAGMSGCTSYECFGAGQHVTQVVYAGATWRGSDDGGSEMFGVFAVVQRLHEMLVLLGQAS